MNTQLSLWENDPDAPVPTEPESPDEEEEDGGVVPDDE